MVGMDKINIQNNIPISVLSPPQIESEPFHGQNKAEEDHSSSSEIFVRPSKGLRKCCNCKELLLEIMFNKDRSKKSGLQSKCRQCSNACVELWRSKQSPLLEKKPRVNQRHARVKRVVTKPSTYAMKRHRDLHEMSLLDEGLTVNNRMHLATKQKSASPSMQQKSDDLEKWADEILRNNPERE